MLRFPKETLVEIVAFLHRFHLDAVDLTSQQFRHALSALSVTPLRRLDVVSLTEDGVIVKANGLRHSFTGDTLRASLDGLLRFTNDSVFSELRIQFVTRESVILTALREVLSAHSTLTLRMSYADMSDCDILQTAGAVVPGGSVFIEKVCMRSAKSCREVMRSLASKGLRTLKVSKVCSGGGGCTGTELLAFMSSKNADEEPRLIEVEDSVRLSPRFVHKLVEAAETGKLSDFDARISDRSVAEQDMSGFEHNRTTRPTFLESVAAYDFGSLGLKVTFLRDSTELQIAYRKSEK